MSNTALLIVSLLYVFAAYGYLKANNWGMALALLCYALANVGLIWATMK